MLFWMETECHVASPYLHVIHSVGMKQADQGERMKRHMFGSRLLDGPTQIEAPRSPGKELTSQPWSLGFKLWWLWWFLETPWSQLYDLTWLENHGTSLSLCSREIVLKPTRVSDGSYFFSHIFSTWPDGKAALCCVEVGSSGSGQLRLGWLDLQGALPRKDWHWKWPFWYPYPLVN